MKTNCFLLILIFWIGIAQAQNRAAHLTSFPQYYRCGNIAVSGTQLTVEALVKLDGTGPYVTGQSANDIVSKHNGAGDANYILRPDHAEISTTNGHFYTPYNLALFSKDSFYHVALTYDGSFLKFFVNGCLHSQAPATGNLINNSFITTIGQLASNPTALNIEQLFGYTDEVRIWNRVRTQDEIKANMHDLPNPTTQTGLLAYYKFEGNSVNVQGNSAFDAILNGSPAIETQNGFQAVKLFNASFSVSQPTCSANGSISAFPSGGKAPYSYSLNGGAFQSSNTFSGLGAGTYVISVKGDGLGCSKDTTVTLTQNCATATCLNWLRLPSQPSFVRVGDLDITGNKVTIEATITRTTPWNGSDVFQGDVVSKHESANDCNYLLRPSSAEITTTNGYFKTPTVCPIQLNKTYHVALVYDGATLKFYRNGFLLSQIPASGNLIQNNWQTQIGLYFNGITQENFIGYINEVRIWNIARSQHELQAYMNSSLPSPTTTPGLLAYYTFDNLFNKQGNPAWNGSIGGSATINQTNSICSFTADSCTTTPQSLTATFTATDTVCVNSPLVVSNSSSPAGSYYWSFGAASPLANPSIVNPGIASINGPAVIDYVRDGNNYYGFVITGSPLHLYRLDFGSSLTNSPAITDLGLASSLFYPSGLRVVKTNGIWYVVIVQGTTSVSSLLRCTLGTSITAPVQSTVSNAGIGQISVPSGLKMFENGGNWYGLTVNSATSTMTLFNFGTDIGGNVAATNLGNPGLVLAEPYGLSVVEQNGNWTAIVVNSNGRLIRVNFGNSLYNTAIGIDMGNAFGFSMPSDIEIINHCGQYIGYVPNRVTSSLTRLNFGSSITNVPTASTLSGVGLLIGPRGIGRFIREGNSLYSFIANGNGTPMIRLDWLGAAPVTPQLAQVQNPSGPVFSSPGTYNLSLSINDGQPSQQSVCRQVVVVDNPVHTPLQNVNFCSGDSLRIGTQSGLSSYTWSTSATTDSITVSQAGLYWVQSSRSGCANRDSFNVVVNAKPLLNPSADTSICRGASVTLAANPAGAYTYSWFPASGLSGTATETVIATPSSTTSYFLSATGPNGCIKRDTINITVRPVPQVALGADTLVCSGAMWTLNGGNPGATYLWQDGSSSQTLQVADSGLYHVIVLQNGCAARDTIHIGYHPKQPFAAMVDTAICAGSSIQLALMTQGPWNVTWTPTAGLSSPTSLNPLANPTVTTTYIAQGIGSFGCTARDSVVVTVRPKPVISITPASTICAGSSLQLNVNGGTVYQWAPAQGLSATNIPNPIVSPSTTTTYQVMVADQWQCSNTDSVRVTVRAKPSFVKPADTEICAGDSVTLVSQNSGYAHNWSPATSLSGGSLTSPYAYPSTTTTYLLTVSDPACSYDSTFQVTVQVNPLPDIQARKLNEITCAQPGAQLQVTGGLTYLWSPATGLNNANSANPIATITTPLQYTVSGTDAKGCSNVDTLTVNVFFGGALTAFMPNAFTPNGDGLNDCFGIRHWGPVTELDFSIYNRWGQLIFHTTDARDCWDGTLKGKAQATGVFAYVIKAKTSCGGVQRNGLVTLIR